MGVDLIESKEHCAAAVEPWQCTGMYHHQPSTSHRHPSGSKSIANKCTSVPIIIVILLLFVTIIIIVQWGCISWAINYFTIRFNYNTPVSRAAAANWPGMCFRVSHYSQVRPGTWISWRDDGWLDCYVRWPVSRIMRTTTSSPIVFWTEGRQRSPSITTVLRRP